MTREDQRRWDERYTGTGPASGGAVGPPGVFAAYADSFPTTGRALDIACGRGYAALWLAQRGLEVVALDISAVSIGQARELARHSGVDERCRFEVVDLDDGLPPGPPVDVIVCHKFRDRRLDQAVIDRLAPGGLLAIAALSEVGAEPGPFRAAPGELAASNSGARRSRAASALSSSRCASARSSFAVRVSGPAPGSPVMRVCGHPAGVVFAARHDQRVVLFIAGLGDRGVQRAARGPCLLQYRRRLRDRRRRVRGTQRALSSRR